MLIKGSNEQRTCEDKTIGKLFCTNRIPTDPHGNMDVTVLFTLDIVELYHISNQLFVNETWTQVERL